MSPPFYTIPTRQATDLLFGPPLDAEGKNPVPIGGGDSVDLPVREVDGYARIHLFLQADQPLSVQYFEGCDCEKGPYSLVSTSPSSAVVDQDGNSINMVRVTFEPVGPFGFIRITNTGGQPTSVLQVCGKGLPIS